MAKSKHKKEEDDAEDEVKTLLSQEVKRSIAAVVSFVLAAIFVLGFLGVAGVAGKYLDLFSASVFGWGKWLFPVILTLAGLILLRRKTELYIAAMIGLGFVFIAALGILHIFFDPKELLEVAREGRGGGYIGYGLSAGLTYLIGRIGTMIVLAAMLIIGVLVAFSFSLLPVGDVLSSIARKVRRFGKEKGSDSDEDEGSELAEGQDGKEDVAERGGASEEAAQENQVAEIGEGEGEEQEEFNAENIANVRFDGDAISTEEAVEDVSGEEFMEDERGETVDDEEDAGDDTSRYEEWEFPDTDLLNRSDKKARSGDTEKNLRLVEETLRQFGVEVEPVEAKAGPTVTQYTFRPAPGVRLERITALGSNLALALSAKSIRIEAPVPGKSLVGIEIPNEKRANVTLREILESKKFRKSRSPLTVAIGKGINGGIEVADIEKMPHLLIAGTTGSGKSVCLNTILLSLLYRNTPEQLRLILVDPKRVELSLYNEIPHLYDVPVIVENKKVLRVLKWAVGEMERRYEMLQDNEARDIRSYNQKVLGARSRAAKHIPPYMPYVVIVIDELGDLMASHGKEVEGAIVRLSQMARAVGIHLIIAMQRPSAQVLTGLIKSNITTRISFKVPTQVDSRTIIDKGGAEKLLGNGDMLYITAAEPAPRRLQGAFASGKEVKRVVEFIREQGRDLHLGYSDENPEGDEASAGSDGTGGNVRRGELDLEGDDDDRDELFSEAKELVEQLRQASATLLQTRFRVGYSRATRIMHELEDAGIIGPKNGAKPREVLTAPLDEKQDTMYDDPASDMEKREKWNDA